MKLTSEEALYGILAVMTIISTNLKRIADCLEKQESAQEHQEAVDLYKIEGR